MNRREFLGLAGTTSLGLAIGPAVVQNEQLVEYSKQAAETDLKEATIRPLAIDPEPESVMLFGTTADQLIAYADEMNADLICVNRTAGGSNHPWVNRILPRS